MARQRPSAQGEFSAALLDPERAVPAGVVAPDGGAAGRRFAVYRNNVIVALIDALVAGFAVTRGHLGEDCFRRLARDYARAHPPANPLMRAYGDGFPDFLAAQPVIAERWPWVADVARLECLLRRSRDAADRDGTAAGQITGADPEALLHWRALPHPSLQYLRSPWPVLSLWRWRRGEPSPSGAEDVLLVRPQLEVCVHRLAEGGADFLAAMSTGATLAECAAAALAQRPAADIPALLQLLVSSGAIVQFATRSVT